MSTTLPTEDGVIEFRPNGSVTVAGHRIRLKTVYEGFDCTTVDPALLARVREYIERNAEAVKEHAAREDKEFERLAAGFKTLSLDELREKGGE